MSDFLRSHRNSLVAFAVLVSAFILYIGLKDEAPSLSAHLGHVEPSDSSRKFDVALDRPDAIEPGREVEIGFRIFDKATGEQVTKFDIGNEKLMHLVIVNDALDYFDHVHPDFDGERFTISYTFPKDDGYRLYIDYTPTGASEQQTEFVVAVGEGPYASPSLELDANAIKTTGGYDVRLFARSFKAKDISSARSLLVFSIADAQTGAPMKGLRPYLGAFGHLVMINAETHEYIHAHPVQGPLTDDRGGPDVSFMPMPLDGSPVKPGIYRLFAQFQDSKNLFVVPFTVRIE